MNIKAKLVGAAMGALGMVAVTGAAQATSILTPGVSTGLALGAPLPEGVYDITILTYGVRGNTDVTAAVPAWLIWSTPWTILGGRVILDTTVAGPAILVGVHGGAGSARGFGNSLLDAQVKWNFGNGFNAGIQEGVYLPSTTTGIGEGAASFQQVVAFSYLKDGYDLSATLIYGSSSSWNHGGAYNPAWFNYDLTATKKIGKWEVGLIGFGSTDLTATKVGTGSVTYSQFALGALVGYSFGGLEVQLKYSHDLVQTGYGKEDSRIWANFIVPLWNPEAPKAVAAKY